MSGLEIRTVGAVDDWSHLRWTNADGDALPLKPPRAGEPAQLPPSPFGIAYPVALEGVGRVFLWASGLTARSGEIMLERELASRYYKAAGSLVKQYARRGVPMDDVQQRLKAAQSYYENQHWQDSLTESVLAAEQGVVRVARARLQRMRGRTAFLWGVCAGEPDAAEKAMETLAPTLNLIHLALDDAKPSWRAVVQQAQSLRLGIAASLTDCAHQSAHGLEGDALRTVISAYRGQIRYWSVAAQVQRYPIDDATLNALRELCAEARAIDFGIVRLLHGVQRVHTPQSAYPVLDACIQRDVPFEAVHLEWRWYDGSLYDLDQLLERYGELGKPIHLTLCLPPETGYSFFSRAEPLEWTECAALIALSKPYVTAVRVPLQPTAESAGALNPDGNLSAHWERITEQAAWNRQLQD
ncbi:MAG: hypothetical protein NZ556_04380 [Fimbriimonadales bacterium]|nr:hypothetical protein [Fimbriimonadales bacterium]